ncbi:hypothetical protein [Verrucomicrobium spinosum]|uniref:hypothetical protein n=1 Tax=Verrucomicrobium spinosum TaxID=2736 RepID=UPI000AD9E82D|nr:hypothetical protein [Verrucomicrobium spinosum]
MSNHALMALEQRLVSSRSRLREVEEKSGKLAIVELELEALLSRHDEVMRTAEAGKHVRTGVLWIGHERAKLGKHLQEESQRISGLERNIAEATRAMQSGEA